ncbi:DDE-type integrase/transposase/recombinase [Alteromonas ponticola]|uniref:Transposase family protein n=1 Tax=Alteromonas ponticola TaxID=2720613 RepID=A0ABX1R530_9ALTE|nr:DDE-type integrase/transposase/recombinase [Alteromonas ponticola]NMH61001.1 transposase family protein [Alteromonas ponticola]
MSIPFLRESTRFTHRGTRCEVLNIFRSENELRYREIHDEGENYSYSTNLISLAEFARKMDDGDIHLETSIKENFSRYLTAEQTAQITYREMYVLRAIKESPSAPTRPIAVDEAIKIVSEKVNDSTPPCRSTVQGWIKRYRDSGYNKLSLIDGNFSTNCRNRQLPEVEEAFQDCIANYYLQNAPQPIEQIYQRFREMCETIKVENTGDPKYNFKIPSKGTFRNRIKAFTDEEMLVAKYGKAKAKQKIRDKLKKFRVSKILERCEMDGLHIHIGIVDENDTTVFLGSIVLMYVMDVYSRTILGYSLHLTKKKSETADLILACLKHTLAIDRDKRWPIVNKISLLVTDASAPATGDQCSTFILENDISLLITKVGQPQEKPFIESLNATVRRMFLRFLPGYLGREKFRGNSIKLGENVEKQASMTLDGFIREFEHFVHEIYHKNPHSGLNGRAPIDVWNEEFNKQPLAVREQVKFPQATSMHGVRAERNFQKKEDGFYVDGRWYRDAKLHKWLVSNSKSNSGYAETEVLKKITILYSQIDVRTITVIHPKTLEPRKVQLSDLETLNHPDDTPLQREIYLRLIEQPYQNLPKANKRFYEPSLNIAETANKINKNRKTLDNEKKQKASEKRVQDAEHHNVDSSEYAEEMEKLKKKNTPENIVIHPNSQSADNDPNESEEWEDDIELNDIGNCEE